MAQYDSKHLDKQACKSHNNLEVSNDNDSVAVPELRPPVRRHILPQS